MNQQCHFPLENCIMGTGAGPVICVLPTGLQCSLEAEASNSWMYGDCTCWTVLTISSLVIHWCVLSSTVISHGNATFLLLGQLVLKK